MMMSMAIVVFVCEHGSAKSLVAASLFERMARERGVEARAISRGTAPDASVPPAVVEALRADGFDVAAFRPQALTGADVAAAGARGGDRRRSRSSRRQGRPARRPLGRRTAGLHELRRKPGAIS